MVQDNTSYAVSPIQGVERAYPIRQRKALPEGGASPFGLVAPANGNTDGLPLKSGTVSKPSPEGWAAAIASFERQQELSGQEKAYAALGKASLRSSGIDTDSEHASLLFASLAGGTLTMENSVAFAGAGLSESGSGQAADSDPEPAQIETAAADGKESEGSGQTQSVGGGAEIRSPERTFMGGVSGSHVLDRGKQDQTGSRVSGEYEGDFSVSESTRRALKAYSQVLTGAPEVRRGTVFSVAV